MATSIRLHRMGAKKRPYYRIVVVDSKAKRDGRYIECVGIYHPVHNPVRVELNEDRLKHYIGCGAVLSDTVRSICKQKGLQLP